jgi:SAM-dependent methyltransferase
VTVLDFAETQLERDRQAAAHYGLDVRALQGDMRDLSCFPDDSFDVVWHGHSLAFIPDPRRVFAEVARVLKPGGLYYVHFNNPAYHGMTCEEWGNAYPMRLPYVDGAEVQYRDPYWSIRDEDGRERRVRGPREFRHALGTVVNGLIERDFVILGLWEDFDAADPDGAPGSWGHFCSVAPPYLELWAAYRPRA